MEGDIVKKENYTYPARIEKEGSEYKLQFIDFDITVFEEDIESLIESAQTELALFIIDTLDRGDVLPNASMNSRNATYIQIWLPYYRTRAKEIYVKKTVTIPQWLDIMAKERGLNFSAALVKGLKEEIGLEIE